MTVLNPPCHMWKFRVHFEFTVRINVVITVRAKKKHIFQALRYWKILFSPADFEPTSVRNCQFLTPTVRNCQHAVPEQVLGLEQSEQDWN